MNQAKRIFVIGHIGAGKALFGKTLAEKLGWQFVDADLGLEARTGRPLSEMVGKSTGVEAFYKIQTQILNNQLTQEYIVVTTDASLLGCDENKKLLSSEFVVYLKVSVATQLSRKSRDLTTLLPVDDYSAFLKKFHDERDHVYESAANLIIDSDDNELDKHVSTVVNLLFQDETMILKKLNVNKSDRIIFHKKSHTPVHLSEQQARCLKLLAQGKPSKEIANELSISCRTVEDYLATIMQQLGCESSKELIALYHEQP